MFKPIKVLHCVPNPRNRIFFRFYIFIGKDLPVKVKKVLKKIQDLKFKEMLDALTPSEYRIMMDQYGSFWWRYFFTSFHLRSQFKKINPAKYKRKFGAKLFFMKEFLETQTGGLIKGLQYDDDEDEGENKEIKIFMMYLR